MPRVKSKTKNKAGKPYPCDRCDKKIRAKEPYYEWSFRHGGTHRQHLSHGYPRQSQLTESKMSSAYAAIEAAEDAIGDAEDVDAIRTALEDCGNEIETVAQDYQDGIDNMPESLQQGGTAQESADKIESLNSFKDELESTASGLEDFDEDEPEEPKEEAANTPEQFAREHEEWEAEHAEWQNKFNDHLEEQKTSATDALGNFEL